MNDLRAALHDPKQRRKILIAGGALAVLVLVLVLRGRGSSSQAAQPTSTTATPTATGPNTGIDPNTGVPYSAELAQLGPAGGGGGLAGGGGDPGVSSAGTAGTAGGIDPTTFASLIAGAYSDAANLRGQAQAAAPDGTAAAASTPAAPAPAGGPAGTPLSKTHSNATTKAAPHPTGRKTAGRSPSQRPPATVNRQPGNPRAGQSYRTVRRGGHTYHVYPHKTVRVS